MPLIPELGRQRQADLCEFEASLVFRTITLSQKNFLKNKNKIEKEEKKEEGAPKKVQI